MGRLSAAAQLRADFIDAIHRDTGLAPELAAPFVEAVLRHLVSEFGGTRMWVPTSAEQHDVAAIRAHFALTGDADTTCRKHRISRATLYRLMDH